MQGREKCTILRRVRHQIAEANGIEYHTKECGHQGPCKGTCPACEKELRDLEAALARKKLLGKRVAVAALAVGLIMPAAGCSVTDIATEIAIDIMADYMRDQITGMAVPTEETYELEGEIAETWPVTPEETYELEGDVAQILPAETGETAS